MLTNFFLMKDKHIKKTKIIYKQALAMDKVRSISKAIISSLMGLLPNELPSSSCRQVVRVQLF
jgi:hypothetical protein